MLFSRIRPRMAVALAAAFALGFAPALLAQAPASAPAKTDTAYHSLVKQLKDRTVEKTYVALVHGVIKQDKGVIEAPIGYLQLLTTAGATGSAHDSGS